MTKTNALRLVFAPIIGVSLIGAAANSPSTSQVQIPPGSYIQKIVSPKNLSQEDLSALLPTPNGFKYYYRRFENKTRESGASYTRTSLYFISILDVDYLKMDRFAGDLLSPAEGRMSVDLVLKSMPNLMAYLREFSTGEIGHKSEPMGEFQKVIIEFKLNQKAFSRRYPGFAGNLNSHIADASFVLRNADKKSLLRFFWAKNKAVITFLLDPRGYFVATEEDGKPASQSADLGLENARNGVRVYLDVGLTSRATLFNALKLLVVQLNLIRFQADIKLGDDRLAIWWRVVQVEPGEISVGGVESDVVRDSILMLDGTFKGSLDFYPIAAEDGRRFTFMRVFAESRGLDHWLVSLALSTWEQIGFKAMADLAVPISDALLAAKRDIMSRTDQ